MTDEIEWGPWIEWPGGECPIPWAKAGEYQIKCTGTLVDGSGFDAADWGLNCDWWKHEAEEECCNITAYRVRADLHRVQPAEPDVVEKMAEALRDVRYTLVTAAKVSDVDPVYDRLVRAVCEQVGYGAVMATASALWRKELQREGYPAGGEFCSGPCRGTAEADIQRIDAALAAYAASKETGR